MVDKKVISGKKYYFWFDLRLIFFNFAVSVVFN